MEVELEVISSDVNSWNWTWSLGRPGHLSSPYNQILEETELKFPEKQQSRAYVKDLQSQLPG